jgi:hypothetical protein
MRLYSVVIIMLFCVLFVCKCVLPTGDNPTAVNKYIIIISSVKFSTTLLLDFWIRPANDSVLFVGLEFKTLYVQSNLVKTAAFIRHLACSTRYSAVPINSSLLTRTICHSVKTTQISVTFSSTVLVSINMEEWALDYDKPSLIYANHSYTLNN